jgi:flagellar biogenesis protein FliO
VKRLFRGEAYRPTSYGIKLNPLTVMITRHYFLYKISIVIIVAVFFQITNTCSADNSSGANFDQDQYGQNQYNKQKNNNPNNPNSSRIAFAGHDTSNPPNTSNASNFHDPIHEPLPLPYPPKPAANYKNDQLNALKNIVTATAEPTQPPPAAPNNNPTIPAIYTRKKTTPTPIILTSVETTTNPNTTTENTPQTTPKTSPNSLPDKPSPDPTANNSNTSDNPDDLDKLNVEENQSDQNSDIILDQKIQFSKENDNKSNKLKKLAVPNFLGPIASIIGSLLIVISIFLILALLFRKISPTAIQSLPKEAFESLGKACLSQKLQVHLLRLGNRLILVSATNDTLTPITEITDPDEVVAVLGMCRQLNNNGINKFHQNLTSQLNSTNHKNNTHPNSKKNKNQNDHNDYFGGNMSETNDSRHYRSQSPHGIDIYNEPDNSLAAILASGIERKGGKS